MIPGLESGWLHGLVGDEEAAHLWSPERQLEAMIAFEAAHARALGRAGLLDAARAGRLARDIEGVSVDGDALRAGAARDGVPVVALVACLRAAVADDADRVHEGATSQDVLDTALALVLRDTTTLLLARLGSACKRLDALDARFGARTMTGRTRMQAARDIRVADRLAAWRAPLVEHADRLESLRPRVERVQLGGAVGNRDAFGAHGDDVARHLAAALGLGNPPTAWHTTREPIVEYGSRLALVAGSLGKLGQDVCLMSQQGIDEFVLADGGGSSAMPHKRNPIKAELLVTLARFAAVQVSGLHHAMVHEQERSGTAWTLEWLILPQLAMATARALAVTVELLDAVERIGAPSTDEH